MIIRIIIFLAFLCFSLPAYCAPFKKLKTDFLRGEYHSAIREAESELSKAGRYARGADELHYILGLSYLKTGDYEKAVRSFKDVLNNFRWSEFSEDARLGLADAYFLGQDYNKAERYFNQVIADNPRTPLLPHVYLRLSQIRSRENNLQAAQGYLEKIRQEFPLSLEAKISGERRIVSGGYSVQVGSFLEQKNARNLIQELLGRGYPAYIEKATYKGRIIYRVRVGNASSLSEAQKLAQKLSRAGYPTRVCY